jgi:hypothetical protein
MADVVLNYEGKQISDQQVEAFRSVLESNWLETLARPGGIREWNSNLLAVTESRRTIKNPDGTTKLFYSWCGDWVTYHLERAGCLHGRALNRKSLNGGWAPGMNLNWLRAWAGEALFKRDGVLVERFEDDVSSGLNSRGPASFHPWDNELDVCTDGYVPALGDLLILPRKNGDHIEFFIKREGSIVTVCAGAQVAGTALVTQRNLNTTELVGVIDISGLVTSEPF